MLKPNVYRVRLVMGNTGCRFGAIHVNRIQKYLQANGHRLVHGARGADFVIVNSCVVFKSFEDRSVDLAREFARGGKAQVIILGCVSRINTKLPEKNRDILFLKEETELNDIFARRIAIEDIEGLSSCQSFVDDFFFSARRGRRLFFWTLRKSALAALRLLLPKDSRLLTILGEIERRDKYFVEISRGCAGKCSYCVERIMRPGVVSRKTGDILADIAKLYRPHLKLCLTADDCGAYGLDIRENIFGLIESIKKRYPDVEIELCNVYPSWIEKYESDYMELVKTSSVSSINIPIQSGSSKILKKMNRRYSVNNVLRIVEKMKRVSPRTLIWTHILVGFPGETRRDFRESLRTAGAFDFFYWYHYSERERAPSFLYEGKVPEETKKFRGQQLWVTSSRRYFEIFCRDLIRFRPFNSDANVFYR